MKKLFTISAALFALALVGCEDPSEDLFSEVEKQNIEIFDDSNLQTSSHSDADIETD